MAVLNPMCRGGCCPATHPDFGPCDNGMIRGAIFDEDTNRWVPTDWHCRTCDGTGHTDKCLANAESDWAAWGREKDREEAEYWECVMREENEGIEGVD